MMDEMVAWMRAQIAKEQEEAERGHSDNAPSQVLAQCEAFSTLLDQVLPKVAQNRRMIDSEWGVSGAAPYEGADVKLVKALGLAFQHHSGYREEWRP